jgi:hypothetical protein
VRQAGARRQLRVWWCARVRQCARRVRAANSAFGGAKRAPGLTLKSAYVQAGCTRSASVHQWAQPTWTYAAFKVGLAARFAPRNEEMSARTRLARLEQTSAVADYVTTPKELTATATSDGEEDVRVPGACARHALTHSSG